MIDDGELLFGWGEKIEHSRAFPASVAADLCSSGPLGPLTLFLRATLRGSPDVATKRLAL